MKKKKSEDAFYTKEIKKGHYVNEDYKMALSFFIVLLIVIGLIGLLFFLNGKFVTKDEFQGNTTTTTTSPSYDDSVILVNNILTISKDKYYCLVYDFTDDAQDILYSGLVSSYNDEKVKLYSTNLGIALNKKYYNKDMAEKLNVNSYKEFNFTRPALLVINNNKVGDAITDKDTIYSMLKEA